MSATVRWVLVCGAVLLAACSGDAESPAASPAASPSGTTGPAMEQATEQATDLAPSQTAASTAAPPALPPPCSVSQLSFAQVASDEAGVVFVDITNTADAWCEANLSASVGVIDDMEPDVWIDPGAVARLRVELDTASCDAPAPVDTLGLDVNGEPVPVRIDPVAVCGLWLTAFYPT